MRLGVGGRSPAVLPDGQDVFIEDGGFPDLITPHPLGGCNVASTAATGVVDHKGEAFGHKNLFVADGAIVPKAIGLNPSRTIAALAERIASIIVAEGR